MAEVNKKILGTIRGKIGDVVFRERNGKVFAYSKPKKYRKSRSSKIKTARNKFATIIQFANLIKSIPDLYLIWKISKLPGSNVYQRIIKNNLSLANGPDLSINNLFFPPGLDFNFSIVNVNQSKNKITGIDFQLSFEDKVREIFEQSSLIALLYKTNVSKVISQQEKFVLTQTEIQINSNSNIMNVNLPLDDKFTNSDSIICLFGLISRNSDRDIYWSSSKGFKLI